MEPRHLRGVSAVTADIGLALLHVATGLFFTVTGYRKVFVPATHDGVFRLLASHGVRHEVRWLIVLGELAGGLALLSGFLTQLAAAGLVIIMAGAYVLDTWPTVREKNPSPCELTKLCSNALCTPEAQLLIICATLMFTGAGAYSLDALIWSH